MGGLNPGNWIAIVGIIVAIVIGSVAFINNFWSILDRLRAGREAPATIKATINKTDYRDDWRSVNLHVVPTEDEPNFKYQNWRIHRALLINPSTAVLARAENDDYATSVFFDRNPIRALEGRVQGKPQRFALEFFIKFTSGYAGKVAKFRVTFSRADDTRRRTVVVSAQA